MIYSDNPFGAIDEFVDKYKFNQAPQTEETLDYRMELLKEEYQETDGAWRVGNAEELVDGHIDIIIIAMGNLAILGVNGRQAFDRVMQANMAKEIGARREGDPEGLSIVKPAGWVGPDHKDNHGSLDQIFSED